ncbi:MAG TPA: thymidine kinase [Chloroflexota bacterium]|nr:thymidine kinase [Chloroflexota bacterium]
MSRLGSLEVITGCMFAGKTEEVLRRVRRTAIARQKVLLVSHGLDERYRPASITSHDQRSYDARTASSAADVVELVAPDTEVLVIDEAQFFPADLALLCSALAARGLRVIVAGLDLDFRGEPFGPIPALLAYADQVDKLTAVCVVCGQPATRTQRLISGRPASYNDPLILVGAADAYEPRCRAHHEVPDHPALSVRLPQGPQMDLGL